MIYYRHCRPNLNHFAIIQLLEFDSLLTHVVILYQVVVEFIYFQPIEIIAIADPVSLFIIVSFTDTIIAGSITGCYLIFIALRHNIHLCLFSS